MSLSRREFLTGAGAMGGALLVGGCGTHNGYETLPNAAQIEPSGEINDAAVAYETATRISVPSQEPTQSWEAGQFIRSSKIDFNGMALNYDDGPSPHNTRPILDTLGKYGIKATFYLIGVNVIAWPEIAREIVDKGHEVGNHSHRHTPYEANELALQIPTAQEIIEITTGVRPVSNRAPGLTRGQAILDMCRRENMYEVHTTIDSLDYQSPRNHEDVAISIITNQRHPGSMPLQHDGGGPRPTPRAQEPIIIDGLENGYEFMTVTDLINAGEPNPGSFSYAPNSKPTSRVGGDTLTVQPTCNYDPETELLSRHKELEDSISRSAIRERSRIGNALDELHAT